MDWGVSFRQLAIAALLGMFAYIASMERAEAVLIIETCTGDVSIEGTSATECWNQVTGFPTGDAAQMACFLEQLWQGDCCQEPRDGQKLAGLTRKRRARQLAALLDRVLARRISQKGKAVTDQ